MHQSFVFPLDCYCPRISLNKPKIIETDLGFFITEEELNVKKSYDAFNEIRIIPDLIAMVEKLKKRGGEWLKEDKDCLDIVTNWTKKWGFLNAQKETFISEDFYGESIGSIVDEARKFYDLWSLYKAVANKNLSELQTMVKVYEGVENDEEDWSNISFNDTHTFSFFEDVYCDYFGFRNGTFNEENPLESYQWASMHYLTEVIESYINKNKLHWSQMRTISSETEDHFRLKPAMSFSCLLDALYMQFFILLTENTKKICPVCNTPFAPERKDKVYCSSSCKHTAKSQRYRARKNSLI